MKEETTPTAGLQVETPIFKFGDHVIMVNCGEAEHYKDEVWQCRSDSYKSKSGEHVVHLNAFAGYFLCSCLVKTPRGITKLTHPEITPITPEPLSEKKPSATIIWFGNLSTYNYFRENAGDYFDGNVHYKGTIDTVVTLMDGYHAAQLKDIATVPEFALAPLSEQKQEGETPKQVLERLYGQKVGQMDAKLFNQFFVIEVAETYASQHTAKQIEDLTNNNFLLGEEVSSLNNEKLYLTEQIDQYKARIGELEAENKRIMKTIRWICVQLKNGNQKKDWYNESTLKYIRSESIKSLLGNSTMTWEKAKKYGWRCIKVEVTINPITQ